jgi:peptidoglycan-associated lipoprotein
MKIASLLKTLFSLALVLALVAGCSNPKGKGTYGQGADGSSLPNDGSINPNDVAGGAAPRLEGINPETDVDYETLAAYTIYFDYDSNVIKASERSKLTSVQQWLASNPGKQLFLAGHTDKRGTLEYNRGLGERRAQAVRDYLIGLDVNGGILHTISYGEERPVSNGDTEADFAKNRRVQIGVVKK